jgi:FAD/FMN-containing dehydrogenase
MLTIVHPSGSAGTDSSVLGALRARIAGQVLTAGDAGYDQARAVWNGMIDRRPAAVVQPAGVADIQRAVLAARELGLPLSVKSGGHNVAGHAVQEGGLLLDLSSMRAVDVDAAARTARVQGGATWADFDGATAPHGLATTGGAISTTGVAGLTLGGGVGWLVGKHGMSIDNLLAVELVTADGETIVASAEQHPDLFWALRGGGGNFGIATALTFRLHPLEMVLAGMVAFPAEQARDVLTFYREFTANAPDELTIYCSLMGEPQSGARIAGMAICWSGDLAEGERVIAPLLAFGSPILQMVGPMPYAAWQSANNPLFPHGRRYYWKGTLASTLSDATLEAMASHTESTSLPWVNATIEFYAGAMNRVDPAETAFPHRTARYQILSIGAWDDPADDDAGKAWARGLHQATAADGLGASFLNFVAEDGAGGADRIRAGYGGNWNRLTAIKRRYDPGNLFRANNNIAPA